MDIPELRYADSGDIQIAYRIVGEAPFDLVLVPPFMSNIEVMWELPALATMLRRLASFSRLIVFDRRGCGMSEGIGGATPLEEQIDDVRAVMRAAGSPQAVMVSMGEGCAFSAMIAASHPTLVRGLALLSPIPRTVWAPDYEWAETLEERKRREASIARYWGSSSTENPWTPMLQSADERSREAWARYQRFSMAPRAAAATVRMVGELDARDVLPSVQCPTLVLHRRWAIDEGHARYTAEHIPDARYVLLPGEGPTWLADSAADEVEEFVTGTRPQATSDRVLATVLFTDIVDSTRRAAEAGDGPWRDLLGRHDDVVRDEVERHRGRYVKSLGDGALAVFDGPSRAIDAAIAIRERLRALGLEIRAGLHAGECELLSGDDVGGIAVHIGARVSAVAEAGELLVTSTVRDLSVGSQHALDDRGEHELKGVPDRWRIFAVAS